MLRHIRDFLGVVFQIREVQMPWEVCFWESFRPNWELFAMVFWKQVHKFEGGKLEVCSNDSNMVDCGW